MPGALGDPAKMGASLGGCNVEDGVAMMVVKGKVDSGVYVEGGYRNAEVDIRITRGQIRQTLGGGVERYLSATPLSDAIATSLSPNRTGIKVGGERSYAHLHHFQASEDSQVFSRHPH